MTDFYEFSPYIREVKIMDISPLYGEWQDFDNVFTYVLSGEADYIFSGQKYHIESGNIIIMCPFQTHIVKSDPSMAYIQYIFHFDINYDGTNKPRDQIYRLGVDRCYDKNNMPAAEMFFKDRPFIARIHPNERKVIEERFLIMLNEYRNRKTGYELVVKAFALEFLSIFIRHQDDNFTTREPVSKAWRGIEHAVSFISENFQNDMLNNHLVSEAADLTPNYLTQIFKEHLGMSVHQYINYVRIENAKRLILTNTLNFSEVAAMVGYSGIHNFSKVFKRISGITPSEYLMQNISILHQFNR